MQGGGERDNWMEAIDRFVVADAPLDELLQRIVTLAKERIEPVADASITFTRGDDRGWTVASTGALASTLDEAQYAQGRGPCMDAATGAMTMLIDDLATDERYPQYGPTAVECGARSSMSVPFPVQKHVLAALNLYATKAHAFGPEDVESAAQLTSAAGVAVANAVLYDSATQLAANLQEAMNSRAVIEQAKGILMATSHCNAEDAFGMLVRASQRENRKLREIARELVERHSGSSPPADDPAGRAAAN